MSAFTCARCGNSDRVAMGAPPFPDERGARIAAEICTECWEEWKQRQMLLINHYGLNVRDRKARDFLYQNLDAFLFDAGDESRIDESQEGSVSW